MSQRPGEAGPGLGADPGEAGPGLGADVPDLVTPPPLDADERAAIETSLPRWLPTQRWFAGKDRPVQTAAIISDSPLHAAPGLQVHHLVVAVAQAGSAGVYQLPISLREAAQGRLEHVRITETPRGIVYDALHDKEATAVLLAGFLRGTQGALSFHTGPDAVIPLGETSTVLSGEQSNTSLVFGNTAILKVFRRLSPGLNPDIEVHDALTRAHCPYIADLYGWIDGHWPAPDGGSPGAVDAVGSLAMLQRYLMTASDGWELAKASVRDLFGEADLRADEVGGDFAAESERLGATTAEVHRTIRERLPSATLDALTLAVRVAAMRARLEAALVVVHDLRPYAEGLHAAYDDLAAITEPVPVQRIHGDYHLGQVLRTVLGWKLLDFEGEPARPLAERVALDSPLRDVAGMLRSFDYASRHLLADAPGNAQLSFRAAEWAERNRDAFCRGYASVAGQDPREQAALLRAYEADKVVYEAVYETQNRPGWLSIPMAAVERLTS